MAITDPTGTLAQPLETIERPRGDRAMGIARIRELVTEYGVDRIVIGLPLNLDGSRGPQVELTERFGKRVASATGVAVEYQDERWTSAEAERAMADSGMSSRKRRGRVDPIAASLLLRSFIERNPR